jgi:DNA repair exonuclease SbcCD nuclease subunit
MTTGMGIDFIHTADWQLGKPFARFDETLSGRLRAERQDVIGRIADAAKARHCSHVLVAGDVWDSTLPGQDVLTQPLDIMAEHPEIIWWLLPGNHDRDDTDGLWDRVQARGLANIRILREAEPVEMTDGVWLLPAPWQRLHHGEDLTHWMDGAETPDGAIRIGLAHGGIKTFGSKDHGRDGGETGEVIPPNRATTARLDYLALGDWHARVAINSRTHYSGTPEPDRHKVGDRGQVLHVQIDAPGAEPKVTDIATARYDWPVIEAPLRVDGVDGVIQQIEQAITTGPAERHTLVQISLSGETAVSEWAAVERYLDTLKGRCAHLSVRGQSSVTLKIVAEDMDALDAQGSVRAAAQALQARREDHALSQLDRDIASDALRLLFSFAATEDVS